MQNYEYMVMPVDFDFDHAGLAQDESILNGYGKDGWELVSACPISEKGTTCRTLYCLKRLKGKA